MSEKYWVCIIGPVDESKIHSGNDFPPRMAARDAILKSTGCDPSCWSGWTPTERAIETKYVWSNGLEIPKELEKKCQTQS